MTLAVPLTTPYLGSNIMYKIRDLSILRDGGSIVLTLPEESRHLLEPLCAYLERDLSTFDHNLLKKNRVLLAGHPRPLAHEAWLALNGEKIQAIKEYRYRTTLGLYEAKVMVEDSEAVYATVENLSLVSLANVFMAIPTPHEAWDEPGRTRRAALKESVRKEIMTRIA